MLLVTLENLRNLKNKSEGSVVSLNEHWACTIDEVRSHIFTASQVFKIFSVTIFYSIFIFIYISDISLSVS